MGKRIVIYNETDEKIYIEMMPTKEKIILKIKKQAIESQQLDHGDYLIISE